MTEKMCKDNENFPCTPHICAERDCSNNKNNRPPVDEKVYTKKEMTDTIDAINKSNITLMKGLCTISPKRNILCLGNFFSVSKEYSIALSTP